MIAMVPHLPPDEAARLEALHGCGVLDTSPEAEYDGLARLAAAICGTPIALVSLVDRDRQWFKARVGVESAETPRDDSFCNYAIVTPEPFVVPDAAADERFRDNPMVAAELGVRFYAGVSVTDPEGFALGALCVIDRVPRELTPFQAEALVTLAGQVAVLLEARRQVARLSRSRAELEDANESLRRLATTDGLTGLRNRAAFDDRLAEAHALSVRHGHPLSVVMLDVDDFKHFNDSFGHPAGDAVLKLVAAALAGAARSTDTVARYGGEEFVLVLPDTDHAGAMVLAERCRRAVAGAAWDQRPVTVSVGVSTLTPETPDALTLVREADIALYCSKQGGRNRVHHGSGAAGLYPLAQTA